MTRIAVGILLASTMLTSAGAAAGAQPRPAPSALWLRYPAGDERLQAPARASARPAVPVRPTRARGTGRAAASSQRTRDEEPGGDRRLRAFVAAGLGLVAAVLLVRRRRRPSAAAPPRTPGARLADDVRAQLADLLAAVDPSARVPVAPAKRLGRESDTVPGEFPQGGSEILSSEPANLEHERNDLGSRVAGILEAAEDAAEQIRADARAEAASIRRRAEEAAAARSQSAEQEADAMRARADEDAAEIRRRGEEDASERRRGAEAQARKTLGDAEAQARATREAARAMANQIEMSARSRLEALERETAPHEARLRRALTGLRELSSQLDELVGSRPAGEEPPDVEVLEERRRVPLG